MPDSTADDPEELEAAQRAVEQLAGIPNRGSASAGERTAAEWIAEQMRSIGLEARIEDEQVHGTHWYPYGLPPAAAALTGALHLTGGGRVSRLAAALTGLAGAGAIVEDVEGPRRLLRAALPQRRTSNVVAEAGNPEATRTVVIHAHHDSAHGGLMFNPAISRPDAPLPTMALIAAGPLAVGLGAIVKRRGLVRAGAALSALTAGLFADVGIRSPVPGANDDASGVAALLGLARRLVADPPTRQRVILLSTGSEETMLEGMGAFGKRHFPSLPKSSTSFISVDSLGWEMLATRNGEGALRHRPAPAELTEPLIETAAELGYELRPGLRFWIPTDGFIALRAGYPQLTLCSVQPDGTYPTYHTMDDIPEHVHLPTITRGVELLEGCLRRLAERPEPKATGVAAE